jgi:hypothetical protein
MTDADKMELHAILTSSFALGMATAYEKIRAESIRVEEDIGPAPPESVAAWCSTAAINAREVVYPRKWGQQRQGKRAYQSSAEKDYLFDGWDDPLSTGPKSQLSRLHWMKGEYARHFTSKKKDPKEIAENWEKFIWFHYEEKFNVKPPEDMKYLKKGEAMYIMDILEEKHPEIYPKKEGQ